MSLVVDRNRISRLEVDVRRLVQGYQPRQIGETAPPAAGGDHGTLTGLADDDHPQYHNDARGDVRYDAIGTAAAAVATHAGLADPHPTYLTAAEGAAAFDPLGAAAAAQAASQPLDADLTSIAALSTTAFGRGLLALADAAALGANHDHVAADVTDFDTQVRTSRLDQMAAPSASVSFADQQATSFRIENRTSDPGSPTTGQIWLRTDL